jgi:hypothetical protein
LKSKPLVHALVAPQSEPSGAETPGFPGVHASGNPSVSFVPAQ